MPISLGLGGGGLATPRVSNIATALTYAMLATSRYSSTKKELPG